MAWKTSHTYPQCNASITGPSYYWHIQIIVNWLNYLLLNILEISTINLLHSCRCASGKKPILTNAEDKCKLVFLIKLIINKTLCPWPSMRCKDTTCQISSRSAGRFQGTKNRQIQFNMLDIQLYVPWWTVHKIKYTKYLMQWFWMCMRAFAFGALMLLVGRQGHPAGWVVGFWHGYLLWIMR